MADLIGKTPTVIALGYFDSVHIGHQKVINKALTVAENLSAKTVVFTFNGDLKSALYGSLEGCVYTVNEREYILADLGVNEMLSAPVSKAFLSKGKRAFLNYINKNYDVKAYVCGNDYRFGNKGCGDVKYLKKYAKAHGQNVVIVDTVLSNGKKIATTEIKKLLINGEIEKANQLLGRAYSVTGTVFKDRSVGASLGFPTVNIGVSNEKLSFKKGVYAGHVYVDGKKHTAVINYGARPTFNLATSLIEGHILDYSGDLYGAELTIYFDYFLRDIIKFNSKEDLIERLKQDVDKVREKKND
ncbi:MAG: riboflavin biosynthesis protein RibF [Clostridia bacterium]|nr:riboflavin biosynthesis protein RibF [Clostridia bacterium]